MKKFTIVMAAVAVLFGMTSVTLAEQRRPRIIQLEGAEFGFAPSEPTGTIAIISEGPATGVGFTRAYVNFQVSNLTSLSFGSRGNGFDRCRESYLKRLRDSAAGRNHNSLSEARARKETAHAELAELALAERRGELIPVTDAESAIVQVLSGVKTQILAVPASVAQELAVTDVAAECHDILETRIHRALEGLANAKVRVV